MGSTAATVTSGARTGAVRRHLQLTTAYRQSGDSINSCAVQAPLPQVQQVLVQQRRTDQHLQLYAAFQALSRISSLLQPAVLLHLQMQTAL